MNQVKVENLMRLRVSVAVVATTMLIAMSPAAMASTDSVVGRDMDPSDHVTQFLVDSQEVGPQGADGPCLSSGIHLTIYERNWYGDFATANYKNCNTTNVTITPKYRANTLAPWEWGVCTTMKPGQSIDVTYYNYDADFTYIVGCRP